MRLAVLIIGLVIGLAVTLQACAVYGLSGVGEGLGNRDAAETVGPGATGVLTGLLIMVAAGFVLPFPRVATGILVLAALIGISVGASGRFPDQLVWGFIALGLAVMAFFGARSKRRDDAARAEERANLAAVRASVAPPTSESEPTKVCPNCAETIKAAAIQCRFCGHRFESA